MWHLKGCIIVLREHRFRNRGAIKYALLHLKLPGSLSSTHESKRLLSDLFVAELRMGKSYNVLCTQTGCPSPLPVNSNHPDRWSASELSTWIASFKQALDEFRASDTDPWECDLCDSQITLHDAFVMLAILHVSDVAHLSMPMEEAASPIFSGSYPASQTPLTASQAQYGQATIGEMTSAFVAGYLSKYSSNDVRTLAAGFNK